MKVTFIIKKAAKRYDTESTATIYIRLRMEDSLILLLLPSFQSIPTCGMKKQSV